jgi:hypothetical protein
MRPNPDADGDRNWALIAIHAALIVAIVALLLSILAKPAGLPRPSTKAVRTIESSWLGLGALLVVLLTAVGLQDYLPRP